MLAVQADKSKITTIEGLAGNGELHPLQVGFNQCHGLQWFLYAGNDYDGGRSVEQ
jgi:aerobic-type carbon monoxide dehydrogenase small subunit (CoxS/CutS family)